MPFAGRMITATMSTWNAAAGTNTLDITLNKAATAGYSVSITAAGGAGVEAAVADFLTNPLAFAAGDSISLQVAASSAGSNTTVGTFFVIFD